MSDTNTADASANATPQPVAITLNDMKNMVMVLDICTQRGAFRANELTSIGQLFDRLNTFVTDAEAQMAPAADAAPAADPSSPVDAAPAEDTAAPAA